MSFFELFLCVLARVQAGAPWWRAIIECLGGITPPEPPPPPGPPPGSADPLNARLRLRHGSAGCTGTVLGPRSDPRNVWALTAAHCVPGVGGRGEATTTQGQSFPTEVAASDSRADLALLHLQGAQPGLTYADVAAANPSPGTRVWHAGYGVDVPGDRVDGTVRTPENRSGQTVFDLAASSGDSGSGIYRSDTGEIVSVVCCVSGFPARSLWGGSVRSIQRLLQQARLRLLERDPEQLYVPCRECDGAGA